MTCVRLPFNESTLLNLFDPLSSNSSQKKILQQSSDVELAALFVLSSVVESGNAGNIKKEKLVSALKIILNDFKERKDKARNPIIARLVDVRWKHIHSSFPLMGIEPMSEKELKTRTFIYTQGVWDDALVFFGKGEEKQESDNLFRADGIAYDFNIVGLRQHDEQDILLHELARNSFEPCSVSGFAGSGKSTLVARISHLYDDDSTLYLTKNMDQIAAVREKLGSSIRAWTFGYLAYYIIYYKLNGEEYWGHRTKLKPFTYQQIGQVIYAKPLNGFDIEAVVNIVDHIVSNYCRSNDFEIGKQHCPWQLDSLSHEIYIELAKEWWKKIKDPNPNSLIPVLSIHQIKMVDEFRVGIPDKIKLVCVDEAHDLSAAMTNILNRSPQAIITLADQYQVTDGKDQSQRETTPKSFRERNLYQSLRASNNVDSLFNDLLSLHLTLDFPGKFEGVSQINTEILTYSDFTISDEPCAILSRDLWFSFLAIIKLAERNRPFFVMPSTFFILKSLIPQAISYYKGTDSGRSHSQLMGYNSWRDLVCEKGQSNGLREVDIFFRSTGFTIQQFFQLMESRATKYNHQCYCVGLVTESKSKEFKRVQLMPDVLDNYILNIEDQRTRMLNIIYTGLSRATESIILPKREADWLLGM